LKQASAPQKPTHISDAVDSTYKGSATTSRLRVGLWPLLIAILMASALVSLAIGRFPVPISHVVGILLSNLVPSEPYWTDVEARVVELIRMPRILSCRASF